MALLGVLIAPFFIDWSAYRTDFEREAGRILGRAVKVQGAASARLLPFPTVIFTDVVVEGEAPGAPPLLTVDRFRMDAELAPYLSGEIRIFSMELDRPHMRLPITEAGAVPPVGASALPAGATVILENVAIEDGSLTIDNRLSGRVQELTGIDARLSARSLAGPFAGTGSFESAGRPYRVQLSSGAVQPEGGLPLKLTLDAPGLDAQMILDGVVASNGEIPRFEGSMRLASPLAPPPNAGAAPAPAAAGTGLLPPVSVVTQMTATPRSAAFSQTRVEAGGGEQPYILTGAGALDLGPAPRFDLALEGEQVDVDAVAAGGETAPAGAPRATTTFDARLEAARRVIAAVPRPSIPGTLTLTLPVVLAGDTTIRDVAFAATPAEGGWRVDGFRAELPGRTRLEATGRVVLEPEIAFVGDLLLASRQPSGFSDWLTGAVDPAIRRLGQAGLSARVALSQTTQRFEALEVDVGGDVLTGGFERSGPAGDRMLAANLSAGSVDLDALLALTRLFTGEGATLASADRYRLTMTAGPVTFGDAAAKRIDADLAFDGRALEVKRLDVADLSGADMSASGTLAGLDAEPTGGLAVSLGTADPARLAGFLAARLPPSPALGVLAARASTLAPLKFAGTIQTVIEAAGEKPTLRLALDGTAAASTIKLSLALGNGIYAKGTSGRFGLDADLSSPDPQELLGQLGLETLPAPVPAPLDARVSLSAGATGPVVASAALRAPGTELTAEGTFDVTTSGVAAADVGLSARSEDLSPWLTTLGLQFGQPLDGALPLSFGGNLSWFRGDWTLKGLNAAVAGAEVSGEIQKTSEGPVTGRLEASALSVPWLATLVTGRSPESLDAAAPWPSEGFGTPLLPPVDLSLDLSVAQLRVGGATTVTDAAAHIEAGPSRIAVEDLAGAVAGGYVRGSGTLQNANGVGGLTLSADVSGLDLGQIALGMAAAAAPDGSDAAEPALAGTLDAGLSLEASGQSYAALVSSLTGAGRLTVENASLAGLATGLFPPILAASDGEGFRADPGSIAERVAGASRGRRYGVPTAAADLSVTGGVARLAPVAVGHAGETLGIDGTYDVATGALAATLRLDFDPGADAIEGTDPAIVYALAGPLGAARLSADVQPLATYLGARALEREEARVRAIQEQLQERLRLRREARFYRWRQAERRAAVERAAEIERLRLERQTEARERRRTEAEAEARRRAERAQERPEPADAPAPTRPPAQDRPAPAPAAEPSLDLDRPVAPQPAARAPSTPFPSLPGVGNPLDF